MTEIEGREQACESCGALTTCAQHRGGQWLCYSCWHAARERETPYHVVRRHGEYALRSGENRAGPATVYLKEEAEAHASALNAKAEERYQFWQKEAVRYAERERLTGEKATYCGEPWAPPGREPLWNAEPAESWSGGRISHPGYMARRRAALGGGR